MFKITLRSELKNKHYLTGDRIENIQARSKTHENTKFKISPEPAETRAKAHTHTHTHTPTHTHKQKQSPRIIPNCHSPQKRRSLIGI